MESSSVNMPSSNASDSVDSKLDTYFSNPARKLNTFPMGSDIPSLSGPQYFSFIKRYWKQYIMNINDEKIKYENLVNLNFCFDYWKPRKENNVFYGYTIKYELGKKCNPFQDFSIPNTELSPVYDNYVQFLSKDTYYNVTKISDIKTLLNKLKAERSSCQDQMSRFSNWTQGLRTGSKGLGPRGGRKTRRQKKSKRSRKSKMRRHRKTRK
jgi:hypothetical protein